MKKLFFKIALGFLTIIYLSGCESKVEQLQVRVAFSKGAPVNSYANYYNWIKSLDSTIVCLDMYDMPLDSDLQLFKECSGLILTGGTDINPVLYVDTANAYRSINIDNYQDTLELTLIDSALAWGMPVLGICRGHQMLNVALGGSLIKDIPTEYDTTVSHRCQDFLTCFHDVEIEDSSLLSQISGLLAGTVNSNHHQGVKILAPPLRVASYTSDGLPESVEWQQPENKSFLLGVQWHPERLGNDNPLSGKIGFRFVEECYKFQSR